MLLNTIKAYAAKHPPKISKYRLNRNNMHKLILSLGIAQFLSMQQYVLLVFGADGGTVGLPAFINPLFLLFYYFYYFIDEKIGKQESYHSSNDDDDDYDDILEYVKNLKNLKI
uniref:Uncharacterized protein n=1 Tax=Glossina brevipalpis TaxID=37001 RepID=A0A1A9W7A7_9MUSC